MREQALHTAADCSRNGGDGVWDQETVSSSFCGHDPKEKERLQSGK